jgi:SAM-dependent methyltransferase
MRAKTYFDMHAHHHAYHKDPAFYVPIIDHVRNLKFGPDKKIRILDLGCGDGSFIKNMIAAGMNAEFIGSDISSAMIHIAKKKLNGQSGVELFIADGFKLPLTSETKFDLIHIDSVLHHLIGKTRAKSQYIASQMLGMLTSRLSENGILVVEEMYYVSYLIPQITSSLIFYGLKLLNLLRLDLSRIISEYQPGLEVNFFYDEQIERMLGRHGDTVLLIKRDPDTVPKLYRFFLLKEFGHISYSVTARGSNLA